MKTEKSVEKNLYNLFNNHLPQHKIPTEIMSNLKQQILFAVSETIPTSPKKNLLLGLRPYANLREEKRFLALTFKQQGWKQSRIAEVLEVNRCTVNRWLKRAQHSGQDALRNHRGTDPQSHLTPNKLKHLPALMARLATEDLGVQEVAHAPMWG